LIAAMPRRIRVTLQPCFLILSCGAARSGPGKSPLKNPDVSIAEAEVSPARFVLSRSILGIRHHGMAIGTVKFFNTQKGFGFITPTDGSKDVFVHISAVERAGMSTLNDGQRVSYDVITERGKQAAANLQNA
jgi:CspA family cold shock protein